MIQYTIHVPLFEDPDDRRIVHIQLTPDPQLSMKPLRHWANIVLPLEEIDQRTLTDEQRKDGYNAGLLYWCLIQEAETCALLCAAAHVGDCLPLDKLSSDMLALLHEEIFPVYTLLDNRGTDYQRDAQIEERTDTFPEYYNCIDKARAWGDHIQQIIASRQTCLVSIRPGRPGFVYLLRSVSGHWKIGRTSSPQNRLKTFGIQLPFEVEFEHLIPTDNMSEAEASLHARFAAKRINGEWFALEAEDIAWIKAIERI